MIEQMLKQALRVHCCVNVHATWCVDFWKSSCTHGLSMQVEQKMQGARVIRTTDHTMYAVLHT